MGKLHPAVGKRPENFFKGQFLRFIPLLQVLKPGFEFSSIAPKIKELFSGLDCLETLRGVPNKRIPAKGLGSLPRENERGALDIGLFQEGSVLFPEFRKTRAAEIPQQVAVSTLQYSLILFIGKSGELVLHLEQSRGPDF